MKKYKILLKLEAFRGMKSFYLTKELVAAFFDVDIRTIERYISSFSDELKANGMEILKGKKTGILYFGI